MPGCDIGENNREIEYDQPWLNFAIPHSNGKIKNCVRFAPLEGHESESDRCSAEMFNRSIEIECFEFIYASDETNIQTEVNHF